MCVFLYIKISDEWTFCALWLDEATCCIYSILWIRFETVNDISSGTAFASMQVKKKQKNSVLYVIIYFLILSTHCYLLLWNAEISLICCIQYIAPLDGGENTIAFLFLFSQNWSCFNNAHWSTFHWQVEWTALIILLQWHLKRGGIC